MSDGEVIIEVDADTKKVEAQITRTLNEINKKKAELSIQISKNSQIKSELSEIQKHINNIANPPPGMKEKYNEVFSVFSEGQQKVLLLQSQINALSKEYDRLTTSGYAKAVSSGLTNLNKNLAVSNVLTSNFLRRIYNLLKGAFVFNVLSRGFRGLSTLLGNLINRDTILAKTLIVIRANLIRAFAPVWQVILPIIRALGEGLVWITNQLIRFINFLTGSNIKPLNIGDWKEAKKVVGDFYKEVSPKKDMFHEFQIKGNSIKNQVTPTKKVKDNLKKAKEESKKLLASFDKLEVLNKGKLFGEDKINKLKVDTNAQGIKNEIDNISKEIESNPVNLRVDEPSLEYQIFDAINHLENAPLDFSVSDNIDDQIMSQINGLELPTLDFKVNDDISEKIENIKKKLSNFRVAYEKLTKWLDENQWVWKLAASGIAGIGAAFVVANVGKWAKNIIGWFDEIKIAIKLFLLMFTGPGGWAALIVAALVLIVLNWDKIEEAAKNCLSWLKEHIGPYLRPVKDWLDRLGDKITDILKKFSEFHDWVSYHFQNLGRGIGNFFGNLFNGSNRSFGVEYNLQPNSIPKLAQGAVLRGGDPFLAYLNDQPRGQTNIEAPLSTIVDAFRTAINESGLNQQPQINITSNGSMSELVRMLNLKIQDEQIRVGTNFVKGINI